MLVLTRRIKEVVVIGDDIEVVVLALRGNQFRIGVQAPDHIPIRRKELPPKRTST